jgi:nucleoside 2-deoxyribosyltransferase
MKIFMSLKAPRDDDDLRTASLALAEAVRTAGHEPFVAWREIEEQGYSPQQFMPFVREHLHACDLLLVLYHPELRGGLIELGIAYADGIPIWLAHQNGQRVSSSALGCADLVLEYSSLEELQKKVLDILFSSVTFSTRRN